MILKKEFYFIRHGQTDYNVSNLKIDHADVSLNEVGFKQAHAIESIIAKLPVKSICFSPLKRAMETKQIISKRLLATDHEMHSLGECSSQIWNDMTLCGATAFHSGEAHVKDFIKRARNGLNEALSLDGPPLLVAHGGVHWAICCLMAITDHDWMIGNCIPVHFFPNEEGLWRARKLV